MSEFKCRHFEGEIILWAVRWYCRYGISYRDLEQMMGERNVSVDHCTIYRWVQRYAPEIESGYAGSGAVRTQGVGGLTRPISRSVVSGPTCTELSTSMETQLILSLTDTQRQSGETLPWQGTERFEGLGEAGDHQTRTRRRPTG